jgi:hypothetical protein
MEQRGTFYSDSNGLRHGFGGVDPPAAPNMVCEAENFDDAWFSRVAVESFIRLRAKILVGVVVDSLFSMTSKCKRL